jgi:excisionase family DNA binding protein
MARLHMKFRNIHTGARNAGETLFASKPWEGSDEDKQSKFERFLAEASAAYGVPTPTFAVIPDTEVQGLVAPNTIVVAKYSVISVFSAFRQHLQYSGAVDVQFRNPQDAQAWACSLFYTLRPIQFRKMVRAGRIWGVRPNDLLTSATLAARQDEIDEAFAGLVAESYSDDEIHDLEDDGADGEDEDTGHRVGEYTNPLVEGFRDYTVAEAAEILGVSQSTVRNMINDGRLTAERSGRRVVVPGSSLRVVVPASQVNTDPSR